MRFDEQLLHLQIDNARYRSSSQLVINMDGQLRVVDRFHQSSRIKVAGTQLDHLLTLCRDLFRDEVEVNYPGVNQDSNEVYLTVKNPFESGKIKKIHASLGRPVPEEITQLLALIGKILGKSL